jgi:hypothetical protein
MIAETVLFHRLEYAVPLLTVASAISFAALVEQSLRIREAKSPRYGFLLGYAAFLLIGWPLNLPTAALVGIMSATTAALVVRLWVKVPQGFLLAPAKPRRVGRLNPRRYLPNFGWASNWWPAWCSVLRGWGPGLFFLPAFQFGAVWLGGAFMALPPSGLCRRVEWLALLPISRRRLLFMMVLPGIAILLVAPFVIARFGDAPPTPVVSTTSGTPDVQVPATYWHWATDEDGAVIRSPWGEETHPKTYLRLGLPFYNPYSVAPKNSTRFREWQFARATEAVYGRRLPLAQAAELLKPDWVPATRQFRTKCIAALGGLLMFLLMLLLTFWFKAGGGGCLTTFIWFLLFLPFLGDFLTDSSLRKSGPLSDILTLRFAAILPQSWAALIPLSLLMLAALYLALEQQFKRVELAANLRRLEGPEHRKR